MNYEDIKPLIPAMQREDKSDCVRLQQIADNTPEKNIEVRFLPKICIKNNAEHVYSYSCYLNLKTTPQTHSLYTEGIIWPEI